MSPIVIIDDSLNKFKNHPTFKEKVEKANDMLRNVGLPKDKKKRHA